MSKVTEFGGPSVTIYGYQARWRAHLREIPFAPEGAASIVPSRRSVMGYTNEVFSPIMIWRVSIERRSHDPGHR